jgi:autotransporter-associated beta strand protein
LIASLWQKGGVGATAIERKNRPFSVDLAPSMVYHSANQPESQTLKPPMRRPTLLSLLLCVLTPAVIGSAGVQTNLYVSPNGSSSAFSQSQPGNLYAAVGVVRTLNTNMTGDIVVNLYGGTYQLTNSLELAQNGATNDSGTGGFNVIYQAYPGQIPIISGGTNVTGWTLYNAATNIWSAFVGTGVNSRQLYVNGVRAVRARSALNPPGFGLNSGGTGFTTTNLAMQSWGNPTNIEIVQRHNWKQLRCPIASISGTNIVMQTPGWTYTGTTPTPGRPWNGNGVVSLTGVTWVENAFELLTSPGMWYLNEATGYLYYIPRPGENMATANVVMPFLEKLIDANGSYPTNPIHNIVLSGLTFEYGTWLLPSTGNGYADNQTGIMWSGPTNPLKTLGNVSFQTSSSITVSNCFFEHLGGSGLDFGTGCHTNSVIGNHFEDISADGLSMGEVTDFGATNENQMTDGNVIQDNYIRRPGQDYEDCIGIWIGYSMNSTVAHNDVDNTPYTGISLGWGWGTSSYAANNYVESNYVGKVMQTLTDGGSVYSLSEQSNSWHIGNYYKDSCYQDIYLDEGSAYWTIVSNVFDDCAHNYVNLNSSSTNTTGGLENNHNNTATNNFSNTTAASSPSSKSTNDVISNTVIVVQQNWPAPAQAYIESAGLEPAYTQIGLPTGTINDNDSNCVYHGSWTYSTGRAFGDYDADAHVSTTAGDYVDCYFYGTGAGAVCEKNSNAGNVDVFLDGVYQSTVSCVAGSLLPQQTIFSVSNLRPQFHTLRLSNDVAQTLVVDAVTVQGVPQYVVNDTEPNFDHVPSDWTYANTTTRDDYHNDVHQTQINGQYVQYTFTASGITWLSEMNSNMGTVAVTLDGVSQGTVNCSNATLVAQAPMFSVSNLAAGPHTLQLTKNSGTYMMVDAFAVVPVDYWLTATTNSLTLTGTNSTTSIIKVNTFQNFSSPVTLSVSGLPAGATYGFNPPSITGTGFSTLTITNGSNTPIGAYEITVNGVNGTLTNIATLSLQVNGSASVRWISPSSTAWDNTTSNWFNLNSSVTNVFQPGDYALFDDTPGVATAITIPSGTTVQPTLATINSSTNIFTISGPGAIGGIGGLVKNGSTTLLLNSTNSFTGTTTIQNGILKPNNTNALGANGASIAVTNTGTLDINGLVLVDDPITLSGTGFGGNGTVINSGVSQISALRVVTLAGDTTIGGTNRWDIRDTEGSATLSTGGHAYSLTKVGTNQISLVALSTIDSAFANINVQQGMFAIQESTVQVGDPTKTITVSSNAILETWALNAAALNKLIVFNNGATFQTDSGSSLVSGPITLLGNGTFTNASGTSLTIFSAIGGAGSLAKVGGGTLVLAGTNTYTGATTINAGTLALTNSGSISGSTNITIGAAGTLNSSPRSDGSLDLAAGQVLMGIGTNTGNLATAPGSAVEPGSSSAIGTLTINGGATLQGTTLMKLNASSATNDVLLVSGALNYGGTLSLTNLSGTISSGQTNRLFPPGPNSGEFAAILPAIPRAGLVWNTNNLASNGTISVGVGATPRPPIGITRSGSNVILSGATSLAGVTYYLLSSTNAATPLASWTRVSTNTFDNTGHFSITNPIGATTRTFYTLQVP